MADHHLTIAKATFAASLLRPDVTKVSRDEVPHFHALFETAAVTCSPSNIQTCKQWLLNHIIPSSQRTSSFARYLTAFSKYMQPLQHSSQCSISRRRLHLLYLLSDLLHHAKYHAPGTSLHRNLTESFEPALLELVRQAAADKKTRIRRRLEDLVLIWEKEAHFNADLVRKLGQTIDDPSAVSEQRVPPSVTSTTKEMPFVMPPTHGDPSLPFYELPAGNLMPHIIPNKPVPMRPDSIRPLQFAAGPADPSLTNAIRDFLKDVESIDKEYERLDHDEHMAGFDEMGQITYQNEAGDVVGDTYYGWSRAFCEKMKARGRSETNGSARRSASRTSSSSRSPSRTSRKRRRYSDMSSGGSQSDESYGISQSQSREARSREAPHMRPRSRPQSPAMRSHLIPPPNQPHRFSSPNTYRSPIPPVPFSGSVQTRSTVQESFQPPYLGPGAMPIPPPRPLNWTGPWPPPPPNLVPTATGFAPSGYPAPSPNFNRQGSGPGSGPRNGFPNYR